MSEIYVTIAGRQCVGKSQLAAFLADAARNFVPKDDDTPTIHFFDGHDNHTVVVPTAPVKTDARVEIDRAAQVIKVSIESELDRAAQAIKELDRAVQANINLQHEGHPDISYKPERGEPIPLATPREQRFVMTKTVTRDDVLETIRKADEEFKVCGTNKGIKDCISTSYEGADPERDSFAIDAALQYGFAIIDDDAEVFGVTAERLAAMMSAFGFRAPSEPASLSPSMRKVILNETYGKLGVPPTPADDTNQARVTVAPGYTILLGVLIEALNQAQNGKGAQRHNLGGNIPFERQRMQTISELIGSVDGMTYQACKKITEGVKLPTLDRQVAELLGAINYIAGMIVFLRARAAEKPTSYGSAYDELAKQFEGVGFKSAHDILRDDGFDMPPGNSDAIVDPVNSMRSKVFPTGWVATNVDQLFDVLSAALDHATHEQTAQTVQMLARVWRLNSPLLKAIQALHSEIDTKAQTFVKPRVQ